MKEAEKEYGNYEYASAAKLYENILKSETNDMAMLHLADCYRKMNKETEADTWYSRAIQSSAASPADKLHYAEVLQEEGKYNDAIALLEDYLQSSPYDVAAKNKLASCKNPGQFSTANPFYIVEPVVFSSTSDIACFSPFIANGKIYFTAEAPLQPGMKTDNWTGNGYLDIFEANTIDKIPSPLSGTVNSNLHEGTAIISPSGDMMYFTRSRMVNNKPGQAKNNDNHLEICQAHGTNDNWTDVSSLPFNSTEYSCGHPSLTSDGKRMFFISDMPGGMGGTDIYYSNFVNGQWSKPVNAGNSINTNGNEMFPTIHNITNGKDEFYFSSDGMTGAGGLDIFRCAMENSLPVKPERLSAPFNSSADDFGIVFNENGTSGYFSSNRENADGSDRIYSFVRRTPQFFVKTNVRDKSSGDALTATTIEVKNSTTGKTFNLVTDNDGTIFFPADSTTGYSFCIHRTEYFTCFGGLTTGGFKGTFSDTSYITLLAEKIVINKPIRLENIYYDYNKWNIRPDAAVELDKLVKILQDNPQIKIELSSHTDSRGSDKYNMTLSQKRAQSAVDYIVSRGISRDRITAKGYGETVPLNRCVNGVKCTEEEYQWNRRTEFKVTKIFQ